MTAGTKGVAQPCGERAADLATRLRQTERRLRELEQRYETVVGAIGESVYDWDIAGDRIVFYASMERAIGLPPEALKTARDWWDRIHPEDRPHYRTALIAHFKGDTPRFECDYRYRALDDSWRWARQNGLAMRDERGIAVRMMGATGEITELKERERLLAEKSAILETTLENMVQGISFIDGDLRTIAHNRRLREILEFPECFRDGFALEEAFRLNAERGEYGPGDVEELVRLRVELARRFEPHEFERTRPTGA
jgi:PAS domain S-box-containing protein